MKTSELFLKCRKLGIKLEAVVLLFDENTNVQLSYPILNSRNYLMFCHSIPNRLRKRFSNILKSNIRYIRQEKHSPPQIPQFVLAISDSNASYTTVEPETNEFSKKNFHYHLPCSSR